MNKKLSFLSFLPSIVIFAVLNLILFLTVPSARLDSTVFWIAWSFTFPLNAIVAVSIWIYIHKKSMTRNEDTITYLPLITYVIFIATGTYLVAGAAFMYLPVSIPVLVIIIDGIITCVYGLALYYAFFIANRISDTQKETAQKVMYIRLLESDLESCFCNVKDAAVLSKLRALSDKIRFSDPMSHPSLAACEAELSNAVMNIVTKVATSDLSDIDAAITKVESLIDFRNSRCRILK